MSSHPGLSSAHATGLMEKMPLMAFVLDAGGHLQWANAACVSWWGQRALSELVGLHIGQCVPWHNAEHIEKHVQHLFRNEADIAFDAYWHLHGRTQCLRTQAFLMNGPGPDALAGLIVQDITAELRMQQQYTLGNTIFASTFEAIAVLDEGGYISRINDAWSRLTGFSAATSVGQHVSVVFDNNARNPSWDVLQTHDQWSGVLRLRNSQGQGLVAQAKLNALPVRAGDRLSYVLVATDFTELERARQALATQRDQLEALVAQRTHELVAARQLAEGANAAKSAFMRAISHEFKTPLNAIIGWSQLHAGDAVDGSQGSPMRHILQAGEKLLDLVNDMLEYVRRESGPMVAATQPFDLLTWLQDWQAKWRKVAADKGLQLEFVLPEGTPLTWQGPSTEMRYLVDKLTDNAIKFTDRGRIVVRVRADDLGDGARSGLRIQVEDTGAGMDDAMQARLFTPFEQGNGSLTRVHGGTGIGLALAQIMAHQMGAVLRCVRSSPGQGSVFELSLVLGHDPNERWTPSAAAEPPAPGPADTATQGGVAPATDGAEWPALRTRLIALLSCSEASVLDLVKDHEALLKRSLSASDYHAFKNALAAYDFEAAETLLNPVA